MLKELNLEGFRAFPELKVPGLTRVNLFVGKNNAGKTSVLEAVDMLAAGGDPSALWRMSARRGELVLKPSDERPNDSEVDIKHLFYGHKLELGRTFGVRGHNGIPLHTTCEVVRWSGASTASARPIPFEEASELGPPMALKFGSERQTEKPEIPLSPSNGLQWENVRRLVKSPTPGDLPVRFLRTEGLDGAALAAMWDKIVLTDEEEKVVSMLRVLDENIERVAITSVDPFRVRLGTAPNVLLKLRDANERMPLGSMGEGVKRLLGVALSMAQCTDGYFLCDEIDTGLHHSVLEQMWRLVVEGAHRLRLQIFATTHSGDCLRALAWLLRDSPKLAKSVSLHRVERGSRSTTVYSADEIDIAARNHIELRG